MNKKVKGLIQRLGEAIHETVTESEHVAGVVKDIREQGFDVMLMLEATIGLNEVRESDAGDAEGGASSDDGQAPFTPHDLHFLKSLRISVAEGDGDAAASPEAVPDMGAGHEPEDDSSSDRKP